MFFKSSSSQHYSPVGISRILTLCFLCLIIAEVWKKWVFCSPSTTHLSRIFYTKILLLVWGWFNIPWSVLFPWMIFIFPLAELIPFFASEHIPKHNTIPSLGCWTEPSVVKLLVKHSQYCLTKSPKSGCKNHANFIRKGFTPPILPRSESTNKSNGWWSLLVRAKCLADRFWILCTHRSLKKALSHHSIIKLVSLFYLSTWLRPENPKSQRWHALITLQNLAVWLWLILPFHTYLSLLTPAPSHEPITMAPW